MVDGNDSDDPSRSSRGGADAPASDASAPFDDDDALLRALGAVAAAQEREGVRSSWERLARGELSADESSELERRASESADAKALLDAARPLDANAQDRIVAALEARLSPVRRPSRWRLGIGVGAGGLALAAGVALFVATSGSGDLPRYALESSGAAMSRGPSTTPSSCLLHASERGSFELLARPDDAVSGPVAAHAFVVRDGEDGEIADWPGQIDISSKGAIHLLDERRKLLRARELRIVVGRPDQVASARELVRGPETSGPGWQVLRCSVEAHDPPSTR